MQTQDDVYGLCHDYINDYRSELAELWIPLNGWIRSRSLAKLAQATSLFNWHIHSWKTFSHLSQVEALFKKNKVFANGPDCETAAEATFMEAEKQCRITNKRLAHFYVHEDRLDPQLRLQMRKVCNYIAYVLGDFEPFLEELPRRIRMSSGATVDTSRRKSLPYMKLKRKMTTLPSSIPYIEAMYLYYGYTPPSYRIVSWNRVVTVPKNFKTHRTIACEAEGAMPFQLAFDHYAKERLRRFARIDLSSQVQNQELAKVGSITGEFATVDLKAASDTEAYNLIAWVFPDAWFKYLCDHRSPHYLAKDGELRRYAKFSSMGNGSTFATETLVFAAACHAVGSKHFSVYGDDIIIETGLVQDLIRLLRFLGFTPNADKTYASGPFRESCGANWFDGHDVTPQYIRDVVRPHQRMDRHHLVNVLALIGLPEGRVWARAKQMICDSSSPLAFSPYSTDSTMGVWIDTPTAYEKGVLRSRRGALVFKGVVRVSTTRNAGRHPATRFLWHLEKSRFDASLAGPKGLRAYANWAKAIENSPSSPWNSVEHSLVPTLHGKYVRKWVSWFPPAEVTPVHLFWWTEYVKPLL